MIVNFFDEKVEKKENFEELKNKFSDWAVLMLENPSELTMEKFKEKTSEILNIKKNFIPWKKENISDKEEYLEFYKILLDNILKKDFFDYSDEEKGKIFKKIKENFFENNEFFDKLTDVDALKYSSRISNNNYLNKELLQLINKKTAMKIVNSGINYNDIIRGIKDLEPISQAEILSNLKNIETEMRRSDFWEYDISINKMKHNVDFLLEFYDIKEKISFENEVPAIAIFSKKDKRVKLKMDGKNETQFYKGGDTAYYYTNERISEENKEKIKEKLDIDNFFTNNKISSDYIAIYDEDERNLGIPSGFLNIETNEILSISDIVHKKDSFIDSKDMELLNLLTRNEVFISIQNMLDVDLREMNLREQLHLMKFLFTSDMETFFRLQEILDNENIKNNFLLKTFLSTSNDKEFGNNILEIAEKQDVEISNKIFEKYSDIIDSINDIESFLFEEFSEDDPEIIKEVVQGIFKKGKEFLKKISDVDGKNNEEVVEILEKIKIETEIFKIAFKKLSQCKDHECSLESAKSIEFKDIKSNEILDNEELIEQMRKIYMENYLESDGYSDAFREMLLGSLDGKLKNDKTTFYLVQKDGVLIGYDSFTDIDNETVYFANFNFSKEYQGARLGSMLLDETLLKIAEDKVVKAVALKDSKILRHYVEDLGFEVVNNSEENLEGETIVGIELDMRKEKNKD